jgi:hypothetical protein
MRAFRRGLDESFVEFLNREYRKGGWWKGMVDDPALFLGIRDNYLNVYYQGNSLVRLRLNKDRLVGETYYKFLLKEKVSESPYIRSVNGKTQLAPSRLAGLFLEDFSNLKSLKVACIPYTGVEKLGVHDIVRSNRNVVDVEIALSHVEEDETKSTAPRVDFAALQDMGESIQLVFFEAKHFSNSELRANGRGTPRVIRQIERYERLIERHRSAIESSYRRICENIVSLEGLRTPRIVRMTAEGKKPLEVSGRPRLVVFGFDEDQRVGKVWIRHRNKLFDMLGRERVLLRGNARGFTIGISGPIPGVSALRMAA